MKRPDYRKIWELEEELDLPHTVDKPPPAPEYYYIGFHRTRIRVKSDG